jgi:hypothetical protein
MLWKASFAAAIILVLCDCDFIALHVLDFLVLLALALVSCPCPPKYNTALKVNKMKKKQIGTSHTREDNGHSTEHAGQGEGEPRDEKWRRDTKP